MHCCQNRSGSLQPSMLHRIFMPGGTPWQKPIGTEFFADEWFRHFSGGTCNTILFRWISTSWLKPLENLRVSTISHHSPHPQGPKMKIGIER